MNGAPAPDRVDADLAIGCFASLCRDRLADPLLALTAAMPRAAIGVHRQTLAELLPAVQAARLGLAIAPADAPGGEGLASVPLWREEARLAMAANSPLAAERALSPETLFGAVLLLSRDPAEAAMQHYLLARLFPAQRPAIDAGPGRGDLLARVARGEGVGLVLAGPAPPSGVVVRPLPDPAASFTVRAWWREDDPSPALAALLALLRG